ncbi:MAG: glycosyltransferase, partial [Bacteroidales bacterium]|nr:glycosyltransferase [Bacteroidales bacterium]
LILTVCYIILIFTYTVGWVRTAEIISPFIPGKTRLSVIIAARNEAQTIEKCLKSIIANDYPMDLYEIIVADDNSTDETAEIVRHIAEINKNIKLISLAEIDIQKNGKKAALSKAIEQAEGELIIMTDADCEVENTWLSCYSAYYEAYNPAMIAAPVSLVEDEKIFSRLQALEFLSLIGVTCGSMRLNKPLMCNGANLAFTKKAYHSVKGYKGDCHVSGDDVFLMMKINDKFPGKVHFLKSKAALVKTATVKNFKQFIQQRKRWVSKTKKYRNTNIIAVGLLVYLFNLSLVVCLLMSIFSIFYLLLFLLLFIAKSITDFPLLSQTSRLTGQSKLLWVFVLLQFIYIFYASIVPPLALTGAFRWKERTYK